MEFSGIDETFIRPIQPIGWDGQISGTQQVNGADGTASFKEIFADAIASVRDTEDNLAKQEFLLATGQVEDPHSVGIASTQAQLSLDLLVAIRNKALESYNELIRMQV